MDEINEYTTSEIPSVKHQNFPVADWQEFSNFSGYRDERISPVPQEQAMDDFMRFLNNGIPLPQNPHISDYLLALAQQTNKLAESDGNEYSAELGTEGGQFFSSPIVRQGKSITYHVTFFDRESSNSRTIKRIKFHSHPRDKNQEHPTEEGHTFAGFSISDFLEDLRRDRNARFIHALGTTKALYIAVHIKDVNPNYDKSEYYQKHLYDIESRTFLSDHDREMAEVFDDTLWTDEERELKMAEMLSDYGYAYFKFPLDDPTQVIDLVAKHKQAGITYFQESSST